MVCKRLNVPCEDEGICPYQSTHYPGFRCHMETSQEEWPIQSLAPCSCRHCRYLCADGMTCRRHPPMIILLPDRPGASQWPVVNASDWCGEFRPWASIDDKDKS
jgi:hypothetical protein